MNDTQRQFLIGHIKHALGDRRVDRVAAATGMSKITITKAMKGKLNLTESTIRGLCNYLNIEIPTSE